MTGDKSNNIKGVQGIGPKMAAQLIEGYGDLEQVLESRDDNKPALKVRQSASEARQCRQLVELKTNVELGRNLKSFRL